MAEPYTDGVRLPAAAILVSAFLIANPVFAQSDCEARRSAARDAEKALRACLRGGAGACVDEFSRRDATAKAASDCAEATPAPAPTPSNSGRLAVLVEGLEGEERDRVAGAMREGLADHPVLEAGTVRAAREFLGVASLDADAMTRLRSDLETERLIVLEVRADANLRYLSMRVVGGSGSTPRFAEATEEALPAEAKRLVAELVPPPPKPVAAAPTPSPEATPVAVAIAPTPVPASTPTVGVPPAPRVHTPPWYSRTNVDVVAIAGNKRLNAEQWAPLASQTELGISSTAGRTASFLRGAGGFTYSFGSGTADGVRVRSSIYEAFLGVRLHSRLRWGRPYAEAGPALVSMSNVAELDTGTQKVRATGAGVWAGGGIAVSLGRAQAGVQLRYSAAPLRANDRTIAAGGLHVGATLGVALGR